MKILHDIKSIVSKISIRNRIILSVICILLLISFITSSFALFSVETEKPSTIQIKAIDFQYSIKNGASPLQQVVVAANSYVMVPVTIESLNVLESKYGIFYQGALPNNIKISYVNKAGENPVSTITTTGTKKTVTLVIENDTSSSYTAKLGIIGGLTTVALDVPVASTFVTQIFVSSYKVVAQQQTGGTVGVPATAEVGKNLVINITPVNGYSITGIYYSINNGSTWSGSIGTGTTATISMPNKSVLVKATFADLVTPTVKFNGFTNDISAASVGLASSTFGPTGGKIQCLNTSFANKEVYVSQNLYLGVNVVRCTVTGTNGKTASVTQTFNMNAYNLTVNSKPYSLVAKDGHSISGNSIYLNKGSMQYGPYIPASKGCYRITYFGNNLNTGSVGTVINSTFTTVYRSYQNSPSIIGAIKTLNYVVADSNYFVNFTTALPTGLEVTLINTNSVQIRVDKINIQYYAASC